MNNHKTHLILCLIIFAAAVLAANWDRFVATIPLDRNSISVERVHGPHLTLSPREYDMGIVKQSGGLVSRTFDVFNNGSEDVAISDVLTSCSCTSATMDTQLILSGEHGTLTVVFDPNYHFEDDGRFFRTVTIKSNIHGEAPEARIFVEVDYDLGKDKLKFPGKTN
mgnify:FL=1